LGAAGWQDPPVIHRDVKPSNILLDENMVAKLADFGISKVGSTFDTHISTRPAGTPGFLDPDYFITRQLTPASDVYGFGVVLLEMITGRKVIDHLRDDETNLLVWVCLFHKFVLLYILACVTL
jgi:serine/threonine protein kinase